jgi:hypothetical protein
MLLIIQAQSYATKYIESAVDILSHMISISIAVDSNPKFRYLSEEGCGDHLPIFLCADPSSAGSKAGASSRKSLL